MGTTELQTDTAVKLTPQMRELLEKELAWQGESECDIIAAVMQFGRFNVFDTEVWTVWTTRRVYFPVGQDDEEYADSLPRNPCDEAPQRHGSF